MFLLGKLFTMLALPTALMVELLVVGLLLRKTRLGRGLLVLGVTALAACLLLPVDSWIIRPLEDRFPPITTPPERVDGIVVLGGAIDEITSRDRGTPTLTDAANRLTTFVILARLYPHAKLVFTGGSGAIEQGLASEAEYASILLQALDLSPSRVTFESMSRTTWENATNTISLVKPRPDEHWILLTSASHMPRAVSVFRKAGWSMLPWPVGYRSRDHITTYAQSLGQKLAVLDWGTHEWMGLVAYYLMGLSSSPFPAPAPTWASRADTDVAHL